MSLEQRPVLRDRCSADGDSNDAPTPTSLPQIWYHTKAVSNIALLQRLSPSQGQTGAANSKRTLSILSASESPLSRLGFHCGAPIIENSEARDTNTRHRCARADEHASCCSGHAIEPMGTKEFRI